MHDARLVLPFPAGNEFIRIDDDVLPAVVVREIVVENQYAGLQRDHYALTRPSPVAARADDVLCMQEQHDFFAQGVSTRLPYRWRGTATTPANRATAHRNCLRFQDALLLPAA
jgi:hypothetical protein